MADLPNNDFAGIAPPLHALTYQGVAIRHRGEMLNLTDMWRAQGAEPARKPAEWLRSADATRFIEVLTETVGNSHLFQIGTGRGGGTHAHWQIGLAYAKYLSPEFHMWCNTVVRTHMEGRAASAGSVVTGLDTQVRQVIGGIAKAVLTKALADRLEPVERAVLTLAEQVKVISAPNGHFKTSVEYVPALSVVDAAGVPQKGRGPVVRRLSNALNRFCRVHSIAVREEAHTGRRLFPVDARDRFLDAGGREIIRQHMGKITGQSVIPLRVVPKRPEGGAA